MAVAAAPAPSCCAPPAVTTCCGDQTAFSAAPAASLTSTDEETRDMFNAWNAPVKLGVFINPEATPDDGTDKAAKRANTPFHQTEGSGSGSGGSFFTSDSAKRDEVPKPASVKASAEVVETPLKKEENVKKSTIEAAPVSAFTKDVAIQAEKKTTIESNEKKSELSAKASKIEEVQGGTSTEKVSRICIVLHDLESAHSFSF